MEAGRVCKDHPKPGASWPGQTRSSLPSEAGTSLTETDKGQKDDMDIISECKVCHRREREYGGESKGEGWLQRAANEHGPDAVRFSPAYDVCIQPQPRPLILLLNPQLTLLRTPAAAQLVGRAFGPKAMLYAVTP